MIRSLTLCFLALGAAASCNSDEVADAQDKTSNTDGDGKGGLGGMMDQGKDLLDKGKEMAEEGSGMAEDLIAQAAKKLEEVEDSASATQVSTAVSGMLEKLKGMKGTLGSEMPDIGPLKDAVSKLTTKFGGDEAIMSTLKPVIDAISQLGS